MITQMIWKEVPDHPGFEASNTGMIRRRLEDGSYACVEQTYTRHTAKKSYWTVYDPAPVRARYAVHRLVCMAFHGRQPSKERKLVRHLNDDSNDNTPGNLAWGTNRENIADMKRNGCLGNRGAHFKGANKGCSNPRTKFVEDDIRAIRKDQRSRADIAKAYGVAEHVIRDIQRRATFVSVDG